MCCPSCSPLNQDVGSNFDKIAEIIQTRNKSQVRTFYNTEVKRINTVLAPLGVQVGSTQWPALGDLKWR